MKLIVGILGLLWKLYIAVIFTVTSLLFYPIIRPQLGSKKGQFRAFKVFVLWSWTVRVLCFYHVQKVKVSPLPDGPYVILANHISYLDIFLMYSILPGHPFLFMGKSEILKYPIVGAYFRRMNIPVFRGNRIKAAKSLIKASKEVKNGWSIMIFPEGGIPDDNQPQMIPFKQGAFQLAKNLNVPIVPVTFTNNHKLFSDPTMILGRAHPGVSRVYIHPFVSREKVSELTSVELSDLCFHIIGEPLRKEYPNLNQ